MAFEKNMNERSEQLNSDVGSIFVPKNISNILAQVSMVANFPDKSSELDFLIRSLEEESRKVDGFKRELPHCMHLLKEAIEALKKERFKRREKVAVMEETESVKGDGEGDGPSDDISDKKNWMSSAQLWSTPVQYENNFDTKNHYSYVPLRYEKGEGSKRNFSKGGGAFVPFNKSPIIKEEKRGAGAGVEPGLTPSAPVADVQSIDLNVKDNSSSSSGFNRPHMHQHKKQRRCWSPDLHKRFVDALLQLGGPQTATPKQIRELMNVDGLTNDEVKSHLQKYRIHIRKLPWWLQNRCGGSSKRMGPDLGSPQEHFHEGGSTSASVRGGSATKSDNMEDDEDKKPDIHTCKE